MMTIAVQLITAFFGAMGFSFLFHVRGRLILPAALGEYAVEGDCILLLSGV